MKRGRGRRAGAAVLLGVAALLGALWHWRPPAPRVSAEWSELARVTVVDPGRGRRADQTIVIRDGRIDSVADTGAAAVPLPRALVFRGRYVLPGLIDMDVRGLPATDHLRGFAGVSYLAAGVTAVRLTGAADEVAALRRRIEAAELPWPRLVACGPPLVAPGAGCRGGRAVGDAAAADTAVDALAAAGAACVAVHHSLAAELLPAVRAAAARHRLPVVGDVPPAVAAAAAGLSDARLIGTVAPAPPGRRAADWLRRWQALDAAAIDTLAGTAAPPAAVTTNLARWMWLGAGEAPGYGHPHLLPRFTREVVWPGAAARAAHGPPAPPLTPAQVVAAAAAMRARARRLHAAGVPIHPGSGTPTPFLVPGAALWLELHQLVDAGLTAEAAWAAATRGAGAALGVARLGAIEPGAPADLLIFRDDPTRDLRALTSLEAVVSRGRLYGTAQLNGYRLEYARYVQQPLYDRASVLLARLAAWWWAGAAADACQPL